LRRGYAVVTLDNGHWSREIPYNENELTWDNRWPLEKNHDVKLAASILRRWRRREVRLESHRILLQRLRTKSQNKCLLPID
jgi:hypothetical protein